MILLVSMHGGVFIKKINQIAFAIENKIYIYLPPSEHTT
jgi:hypothetical protein